MDYTKERDFAVTLAQQAGEIQRTRTGADSIVIKDDTSPVTAVDKACEDLIFKTIQQKFPIDGFLGEETGTTDGKSKRQWIVDPLDGTRPFIRGIPTHSVLIALEDDGVPVVGVIHLPMLNETYSASKNQGATLNGKAISVSQTSDIPKAMGSALGHVQRAAYADGKALLSFMQTWDYSYGFMDAYSYGCVASGKLDFTVNLLDKAWDCAAAACIVEEAGGTYSDLQGNKNIHNGGVIISNGILHQKILNHFANINL